MFLLIKKLFLLFLLIIDLFLTFFVSEAYFCKHSTCCCAAGWSVRLLSGVSCLHEYAIKRITLQAA